MPTFLVTTQPIYHPADLSVICDTTRVLNADDVAKLAAEGIDNFEATVCLTWAAALVTLESLIGVPAEFAFTRSGLDPVVSTEAEMAEWFAEQDAQIEAERKAAQERERAFRVAMRKWVADGRPVNGVARA